MTSITRRDAFTGVGAAVAAGAMISVAGTPTIGKANDEPLVTLWREARRCQQEGERYDELAGMATKRGDRQAFLRFSDRRDENQNRGFAIEKEVSGMTPETPAGWAIQATMLLRWVEAGSAADDEDLLLARRIEAYFHGLAQAERLAGGAWS